MMSTFLILLNFMYRSCRKNLWSSFERVNIPREKIKVSIKIFKNGFDPNDDGEGRKHLIEGVK